MSFCFGAVEGIRTPMVSHTDLNRARLPIPPRPRIGCSESVKHFHLSNIQYYTTSSAQLQRKDSQNAGKIAENAIFFIIQQIEGHIVYPKVVGSSVGLPALWTLLAVVVGGKVSGVFGIILFIPLFSVIYALVRRSVYSRLRRKGITISE